MISLGLLFLNCEFSAIRSAPAWKVGAAGSGGVCLMMSKLMIKSFKGAQMALRHYNGRSLWRNFEN